MDKPYDSMASLFGDAAGESPAALAAAMAPPAAAGHFDELRGGVSTPLGAAGAAAGLAVAPHAPPTPAWSRFFENLGADGFTDLNRRTTNLERQIRDNGVTYNVYAEADGPQRPWSLDLFPLIITPESWRQIETGVLQRVKLLDAIMADVYGPQTLLAGNLLPPALVHGHPGYLRPMHGVRPAADTHLHIAAFDLARGPDGHWWVVSQRTQAPSGLGYLLENRLISSRLFPEAFRDLNVQRLAASYRALVDGIKQMCPTADEPRIVLLTPGPYNETYFEHAYLARYLGLTLVEGSDLTVRNQCLYLKTLNGLEPVHGLIKRLDDEFLDPLELRSDSRLGVPGLLQVIRAGNVLVANAPGSAFLESTALLGFLPALSRHLLKEELQLPSLATWWCGERAALEAALPQLGGRVIKPTYASPGAGAMLGKSLSRRKRDEWAGRIARESDEHTLQSYLPLSQMPTWRSSGGIASTGSGQAASTGSGQAASTGSGQAAATGSGRDDRILPCSLMLRVFAVSDGPRSWQVLPGGLTRLAGAELDIASMQRGGSSADTWVMTQGEVDPTSLLQHEQPAVSVSHRSRSSTTSRAAENLFWLGRYTERTENTARLARLTLESLNGEDQGSQPLLAWLGELAASHALVLPAVPAPARARRVFERALVRSLGDPKCHSVGYNLAGLRNAASAVRERLSLEQWNGIVRAEEQFLAECACFNDKDDYPSSDALRVLENLSVHTAAMTGAQTDRMTRDDGWRLLSSGRHLERLAFLSSALAHAFDTGAVFDEGGFEALIALFDSTITFHAQYQQRHDIPALLDLLVLDRDNPRSLGWVAQTLRGRLARLAGSAPGKMPQIALTVPDPHAWSFEAICARDADGNYANLMELLGQCSDAAYKLSDDLGARYFTHSGEARHSVGA